MFGGKDDHLAPVIHIVAPDLVLETYGLLVDLVDDVPQNPVGLGLEYYKVVSVHEESDELVGTKQVDRLKMSL